MPSARVGMALNRLWGLGSQVSIWEGPPSSHSRMQAWAFCFERVAAGVAAFQGQVLPQDSGPAD